MKYLRYCFALALSLCTSIGWAQGYQVQPMLATIAPSGADSRLTMSIKNSGAIPITLELSPFRATVDEAGKPTRVDEEKDILIYPAQTIIAPGKEQSVQLRYIGDPALAEARMYGVRVSQLPVAPVQGSQLASASGASSDLKVSFNFLSHIVVSPPGAKADIKIEDAGRSTNGDLLLKITNAGRGIAILTASDFTLRDASGKTVTLAPDDLKFGDFSAFMPQQSRRATVTASKIVGLHGPITPTLTFH